jgi:hypothetical protein
MKGVTILLLLLLLLFIYLEASMYCTGDEDWCHHYETEIQGQQCNSTVFFDHNAISIRIVGRRSAAGSKRLKSEGF